MKLDTGNSGNEANIDELISKNKQLEQLIREFKFVNDFMPQLVWATQPDGNHDFYNKRWYDFTGLTYEETKDKGWSNVLHPEDYDRAWEVWNESLATGKPYEIEYRMRKHDGTYNWLLARAYPLRDEKGKIIKWFGTCTDIQEQRNTLNELYDTKEQLNVVNQELRLSNERLKRINTELDNFVFTASHDLKSPLNNIKGLVDLLRYTSEQNPEQKEIMKMMHQSILRFEATVSELSAIARSTTETHKVEDIELAQVAAEVEEDIKSLIEAKNATIHYDFQLSSFKYAKKDIRSIFFNLLSNAIKYSSPERLPVVNVRSRRSGEYIVIEVEDNGLGIKQEDENKVFQKYVRLNEHIEGTGIGMYMIKRMVENADGRIELSSKEGFGSLFKVYLKD